MSAVFDDLAQQVTEIQTASDDHEGRVATVEQSINDGSIRGQLAYPLDEVTTQLIQEASPSSAANIIGGTVVANAAGAFFPAGWSMTHDGAGLYTIYHTLGTGSYAVTATADVFNFRYINVYNKTSSSFGIGLGQFGGTSAPIDTNFDFIVTY